MSTSAPNILYYYLGLALLSVETLYDLLLVAFVMWKIKEGLEGSGNSVVTQ